MTNFDLRFMLRSSWRIVLLQSAQDCMGTERKRSCLVSPRIINTNGAAIQLAETADGAIQRSPSCIIGAANCALGNI
jgi:hypothetical protein